MGRRASRVDDNQREIVTALRQMGCSVSHLHAVGSGCPDILVGYQRRNYLLEIKDGSKPPSAQKLTPDQVTWHALWRGEVVVVLSVAEAIEAVMGEVKAVSFRGQMT